MLTIGPISRNRVFFVLALLALLVAGDQYAKLLAESQLNRFDTTDIIGKFMYLTYTENAGAFLSLGSGLDGPFRVGFLIVIPILMVLAAAIWAFRRATEPLLVSALVLLGAGGIGNVLDRIIRGQVRDFLVFDFGFIRSAVMNIADLYVLFGIILFIIHVIGEERRRNQKLPEETTIDDVPRDEAPSDDSPLP
jgi:signal peptidase II